MVYHYQKPNEINEITDPCNQLRLYTTLCVPCLRLSTIQSLPCLATLYNSMCTLLIQNVHCPATL
jgi:hypothetical protein